MMVKTFRISGSYIKNGRKITFEKIIRALSAEHSLEKLYSRLGSNHKVKRCQIKIENIEEVVNNGK